MQCRKGFARKPTDIQVVLWHGGWIPATHVVEHVGRTKILVNVFPLFGISLAAKYVAMRNSHRLQAQYWSFQARTVCADAQISRCSPCNLFHVLPQTLTPRVQVLLQRQGNDYRRRNIAWRGCTSIHTAWRCGTSNLRRKGWPARTSAMPGPFS